VAAIHNPAAIVPSAVRFDLCRFSFNGLIPDP